MRITPLIAAAALSALGSSAAFAAQLGPVAQVRVAIGPALQAKADDYGEREFAYLSRDLSQSVEARLGRAGLMAQSGGVLSLTIVDAKPNRPTLEQLGDKPGLSTESLAIGGAKVEGEYLAPDGARVPVGYSWYETNIRDVIGASTWSDAGRAFDRFAERLARGQLTR